MVGCVVVVVVGCVVVVVVGCVVVVVEVVVVDDVVVDELVVVELAVDAEPNVVEVGAKDGLILSETKGKQLTGSDLTLELAGNGVVGPAADDETSVAGDICGDAVSLFEGPIETDFTMVEVVVTGADGSVTPRFETAAENTF